jgi:hypothetical protein
MENKQYKGEFSISYKSGAFNLDVSKNDGTAYRLWFSSPKDVFKEVDRNIDFKRDEGAEYKLNMTNRSRRKLKKWADAIEGDVEAANILNFPHGKTMTLRSYCGPDELYLVCPPTKERPCPIHLIGYVDNAKGHVDIIDPRVDAKLLFPNATVVE